jgi:Electron transfer DM13
MMQTRWVYPVLGAIVFCSVGLFAWTVVNNRERVVLAGSFHSVAHKGTGDVRVVALPNGSRILRLVDVKTYPATDLEVCLVGAPDAEDNDTVLKSGLICFGGFDPRVSRRAYSVPARVDLQRYRAVTIWSRAYQVNFTTAPLSK